MLIITCKVEIMTYKAILWKVQMDLKSQNYDLKVEIYRSKLWLKNHDNVKSNNYDKKSELWQKNEIVTVNRSYGSKCIELDYFIVYWMTYQVIIMR